MSRKWRGLTAFLQQTLSFASQNMWSGRRSHHCGTCTTERDADSLSHHQVSLTTLTSSSGLQCRQKVLGGGHQGCQARSGGPTGLSAWSQCTFQPCRKGSLSHTFRRLVSDIISQAGRAYAIGLRLRVFLCRKIPELTQERNRTRVQTLMLKPVIT